MLTTNSRYEAILQCEEIVIDEINKLKHLSKPKLFGDGDEQDRDKKDLQIDILRIALVRMYNEVR